MPKDFSAVKMQEGSVQLDADANKQSTADADIIKKSYEQLIQQIFDAYWNDVFVGKPTPNEIQQAETKFQDGVVKARQARDHAIALLPP
jgi:hypothetical protein